MQNNIEERKRKLLKMMVNETEFLVSELEIKRIEDAKRAKEQRRLKSEKALVELETANKQTAEKKLEEYKRDFYEEIREEETTIKLREAAEYNKHLIDQKGQQELSTKEIEEQLDQILLEHAAQKKQTDLKKQMERRLYNNAILRTQLAEKSAKIREEMENVVEELAMQKILAKKYEEEMELEQMKAAENARSLAKEKYEDLMQSREIKKKKMLDESLLSNCNNIQWDQSPVGWSEEEKKRQFRLEQDMILETQKHLKEQQKLADIYEEEARRFNNSKLLEEERKNRLSEEIVNRKRQKEILKTQMFQIVGSKI